jgi:hypothetical protein
MWNTYLLIEGQEKIELQQFKNTYIKIDSAHVSISKLELVGN